ncbi:MAG: phosphate regulon sensor histidine kinase PhoR [Betaproteobacteria bacterium]|nr:phosphate regulon sensor histidine kinase PhoR [Betaproteobacteria bacterium]
MYKRQILLSAAAWLASSNQANWALALLALGLVPWVFYDMWRIQQLRWWLALPSKRDLPTAPGAWGAIYSRLNLIAQRSDSELKDMRREIDHVYKAVDELPEGVIVLDRFQHVLWANRTAQQLLGIFGERKPIHHFLREPAVLDMLEKAHQLQSPESYTSLSTLPDQLGRIFEFRLHQSDTGEQLLVFRDTTDAARLDAMRRDFVANVSHEIRTPITVIAGFAETMMSIPCNEEQTQNYLHEILRQSGTMSRLVEDLLTLSSLENAMAPPKGSSIAVHMMLQSMCDEARVISAGRHELSIDLQGPAALEGASNEIESAIRNLITNAIRYTPEGGSIRITWRVRDHEGWITVIDNGIGIAAEHLPRLTERFYRVDRGRSRAAGGTGLGLAIVKHVMNRHQGRIEVHSLPGKGSQFSLVFPASRVHAAQS